MNAVSALALMLSLHAVDGQAPQSASPAVGARVQNARPFRALETLQQGFKRTSRRFLLPSLEIAAANAPSVVLSVTFASFNLFVRPDLPLQEAQDNFWRFNNWNEPTYGNWVRNLTTAPVFPDRDELFVNYFIHPWVGATIHLLYRNHGASFVESLILTFLWAAIWEFISEGAYERPSLNDIMANTAGALAGEAQFRAKEVLLRQMRPGPLRTVLLSVIDPFGMAETVVLDVAEQHLGLGPVVTYLR